MSRELVAADLFCGAGGTSLGAEQAGARIRFALNHWQDERTSSMSNGSNSIMARIIRDIPTFGGTIPKGTSLSVINGGGPSKRPINRWNLGFPATGQIALSEARKGHEFELIEQQPLEDEFSDL